MPGLVEVSNLNFRFSMSPLAFPIDGTPAIVMTDESYMRLVAQGGGDTRQMPIIGVVANIDEDNMSYIDRVKMRNKMTRFTPDLNMFGADQAVFEEAVRKRFVLADVFEYIVTFYAFVLCFF